MTAKRRNTISPLRRVQSEVLMESDTSPKFVVLGGRGARGKSTVARYAVERAAEAGRGVCVADADRSKTTGLSRFLEDVVRPTDLDDLAMAEWFEELVNQLEKAKATVVVDLGGGDDAFFRFADDVQLATLLSGAGITPILLHVMGPDTAELELVELQQQGGGFWPEHRALVLNEGVMPAGRGRDSAFASVRRHKTTKAFTESGGRVVFFPRLSCMDRVNDRDWSFRKAAADPDFGLVGRQSVVLWRRKVDSEFAEIANWLP
jgi:hypothetical protein